MSVAVYWLLLALYVQTTLASVKVLDLLYTDTAFLPFIRQLQHHGLIPYLNTEGNFTILAPLDVSGGGEMSREQVLYHILPFPWEVGASQLATAETLLDRNASGSGEPGVAVRVAFHGWVNEREVVRADWNASNGFVQVIDKPMAVPLAMEKYSDILGPGYSQFTRLLAASGLSLRNRTVFVVNDSHLNLNGVEMQFLTQTEAGQPRCCDVISRYIVTDGVCHEDRLRTLSSISSLDGSQLHVAKRLHGLSIGGSNVTASDIIARDGVMHALGSPLASIDITNVDYYYGLNSSVFLHTVREWNGGAAVGWLRERAKKQLFATLDDLEMSIHPVSASEVPRYFLDISYLDETGFSGLAKSYNQANDLKGRKERVAIKVDKGQIQEIGGAKVTFQIAHGNATFVKIESPLPTLKTADEVLQLERSHSFTRDLLRQTGLMKFLDDQRDITYTLPGNDFWWNIGMLRPYLLHPTNTEQLKLLLLGFVYDKALYFHELGSQGGSFNLSRLNGRYARAHVDGGSLIVNNESVGLEKLNILLHNGVLHYLAKGIAPKQVFEMMPLDFSVKLSDLLDASGCGLFVSACKFFGLDKYIDGDEKADVVLAISDRKLKEYLTLMEDVQLEYWLRLHLLRKNIDTEGYTPLNNQSDMTVSIQLSSGSQKIKASGTQCEIERSIVDFGFASNGGVAYLLGSPLDEVCVPDIVSPTGRLLSVLSAILVVCLVSLAAVYIWRRARRARKNGNMQGERTPLLTGESESHD